MFFNTDQQGFNALSYMLPIMAKRQMDHQNALAAMSQAQPTYSTPQRNNALATYGGPTKRAADAMVPAYTSTGARDGFMISPDTRAKYRPTAGALNISMDFNAAPGGGARGTEVIIPDNASPEVRAAAERYNQMVADFARANGIADYPVRGVRTRSENGRGVSHTVHVEPFFNDDMAMQNAIQANPGAFARIYRDAFGSLDNARLIAPHGVGGDRGAASSVFEDETSFGELMANSLLNAPAAQSAPQDADPLGYLGL